MSVVLTIYSVEEKVGKTTFGINLGVSLINETQKSVLLLDLSTSGNGIPASSMLKLGSLRSLSSPEVTTERIKAHLQLHCSQLFLLTVDAALVREEIGARDFVAALFQSLRTLFDYIIVDTASQSPRLIYEAIDMSDMIVFMRTSIEQEYPIGIIGNQDVRQVVNMSDEAVRRPLSQNHGWYVLPRDTFALDAFRSSGVPFVTQVPYRPISQVIARLARDIGKRLLGIALTGGAALGLTQLGILEVFEQNRVAVDMMIGTSFGAFIGAVYASGIELGRLTRHVVSWALSVSYFSRWNISLFRRGTVNEKRLQSLCETFLKDVYFEELLIPLNVTAFDIRTGKAVVFREGKVLDAIETSMRIPGVFAPFKHTEKYLIDSSVPYPLPVLPLKAMGAHITIAVHSTPSPRENQHYLSQKFPARVSNTEKVDPDLVIIPAIEGTSWREFHRVHELIDAGSQAAESIIPKIEELKWGKGIDD